MSIVLFTFREQSLSSRRSYTYESKPDQQYARRLRCGDRGKMLGEKPFLVKWLHRGATYYAGEECIAIHSLNLQYKEWGGRTPGNGYWSRDRVARWSRATDRSIERPLVKVEVYVDG